MPGGRPTSYRPEYCETILDYVGRQGKSITQFASFIGVHKSSVYEWAKNIPEFSDALRQAAQDSESFWEDKYTNYIGDKNCNPALLQYYMAKRFKSFRKDSNEDEKPVPTRVIINVRS